MNTDLFKGYIADYEIQRIPFDNGFCQIFNDDLLIRIELFHNSSGDGVHFDRKEIPLDRFRHQADKVPDSRAEFTEIASGYSCRCGNLPHEFD